MKTYIKYIVAAFILPVLFSCQEKEPDTPPVNIEPEFPTLVKNFQVKPGEELTFTFTPNLDWELSLSEGSFEYFKLLEGNGRQRERLTGNASDSEITVKIWVNPLEEFDNNRSCTLTMTMGGQSQVVAEYMRPAKERTLTVYAAKVQDGVFVKNEAGAYEYEAVELQNAEVLWSDEDAAFMLPIKLESNCAWDIDRTSFPSWLELNVPNETMGTLELVLKGISLQAATGKVVFTSGGNVLKEVNVSIDSCSELAVYSAKYESGDWVYVDLGYEYTENAQDAITMVWTGSDIRIPVMVDSKCEWSIEMPEWITAELDDRRSGEDHFVLKCNPQNYPLDETSVTLTFKYAGQVIKTVTLTVPGCREMISHVLGMSLSTVEFNYTGQFKTTSGYMDAPLKGTVTAPTSMVLRKVEIVDGQYVEAAPAWLNCELNVDADTDTKLVLQTKSLEISVTENLTQTERSAYIFLLPRQVESLAELFEEDKCTVKEAYQAYVIPVVQAFLPADYLTPESTTEEMAAEGAYIVKSEKTELYECFGATRYAYEIKYENTWSSDVAKMYLTYPYAAVEYYDADKQLVANADDFWIKFTDYQENKTFGAITIPLGKYNSKDEWIETVPQAGTSYVVFKDADGATLCVVEFTYAPVYVEPEEPELIEADELKDANMLFKDKNAAEAAGATLFEVLAVSVPEITDKSTVAEINFATYKKNLAGTLRSCKNNNARLYRLTYTKADTELVLNFSNFLKGKAKIFTVNPHLVQEQITVDGNKMDDVGGQLVDPDTNRAYAGMPKIKMMSLASITSDELDTLPIVILFHDSSDAIVLAVECILNE